MRAKTEEILAKLRMLQQHIHIELKSVELYAGQFDDPEKYKSRIPGLLLFFRDNDYEKIDYEYDQDIKYSAILIHSNKKSEEDQILEALNFIEIIKTQLQTIRGITIVRFIPIESSKTLVAFQLDFDYKERK